MVVEPFILLCDGGLEQQGRTRILGFCLFSKGLGFGDHSAELQVLEGRLFLARVLA